MLSYLLMICLFLRSTAAAFATHHRGVGSAGCVVVGRGDGRKKEGSCGGGERSPSSPTSPSSVGLRQTPSTSRVDESSSSFSSSLSSPPSIPLLRDSSSGGHIAFRLARRSDVAGIQACNLATLPENYNANFFVQHVRSWPELSLVAEHIPDGYKDDDDNENGDDYYSDNDYDRSTRITPLNEYWIRERRRKAHANNNDNGRPKKEIVGYILGKVEDSHDQMQKQKYPPSSRVVPMYDDDETLLRYLSDNDEGNNNNHHRGGAGRFRFLSPRGRQQQQQQLQQQQPMSPRGMAVKGERLGHVTSLAVQSHARRLGIGSSLLRQLHYHLRECHAADSVGLHVRVSNLQAVRLYVAEGYDVADIMPLYYGDGEDAYFMKRDLLVTNEQRQSSQQLQSQRLRRGEKEREDWLNHDATRNGSFFEGRKSMREMLSDDEETRAWAGVGATNNNNINNNISNIDSSNDDVSSHFGVGTGQFQRSFRSFLYGSGGEQMRISPPQQQGGISRGGSSSSSRFASSLPRPWEAASDSLRLPRYMKVMSASISLKHGSINTPIKSGMNLVNPVNDSGDQFNNHNKEEEYEAELSVDMCVATGSV